jgi:hypothetical protein
MSGIIDQLQNLLQHSGSVTNLRDGLRIALDHIINLEDEMERLGRRSFEAESEPKITVAVDSQMVELLSDISMKLDTLIDQGKYS